jgi:hypothetical protein
VTKQFRGQIGHLTIEERTSRSLESLYNCARRRWCAALAETKKTPERCDYLPIDCDASAAAWSWFSLSGRGVWAEEISSKSPTLVPVL